VVCAGLCRHTGGGVAQNHPGGGPGHAAWRLSRSPDAAPPVGPPVEAGKVPNSYPPGEQEFFGPD
jgi:hypothetical protein